MLIPLVTAESFGLEALGKLLALIISVYSIGQWAGPALAGRIFNAYHSIIPPGSSPLLQACLEPQVPTPSRPAHN
jgi:hypothetical protein